MITHGLIYSGTRAIAAMERMQARIVVLRHLNMLELSVRFAAIFCHITQQNSEATHGGIREIVMDISILQMYGRKTPFTVSAQTSSLIGPQGYTRTAKLCSIHSTHILLRYCRRNTNQRSLGDPFTRPEIASGPPKTLLPSRKLSTSPNLLFSLRKCSASE